MTRDRNKPGRIKQAWKVDIREVFPEGEDAWFSRLNRSSPHDTLLLRDKMLSLVALFWGSPIAHSCIQQHQPDLGAFEKGSRKQEKVENFLHLSFNRANFRRNFKKTVCLFHSHPFYVCRNLFSGSHQSLCCPHYSHMLPLSDHFFPPSPLPSPQLMSYNNLIKYRK